MVRESDARYLGQQSRALGTEVITFLRSEQERLCQNDPQVGLS